MDKLNVKKYISKKALSIVALVVFCTLTALVIYYVLPKISSTKKTEDDKTSGGFNTVLFSPLEKSSGEIEVEINELSRILASVGTGATQNYWEGWTWETHVIEASVVKVDSDLGDLVLKVTKPMDHPLKDKTIRVGIECSPENTVAYANGEMSPTIIGYNFNLLDKASEGDLVWGYCMQEECLSIGRNCILLKLN